MQSARKASILGLAFLIVVSVLVAGSVMQGYFGYHSVCRKCGVIRYTREWDFPFTFRTLFWHSSIQATPVSRALASTGVVGPHRHEWMFGHGRGSRSSASGPALLMLNTVESEGLARVFEACARFGETQFRDRLLQLAFDPDLSEIARGVGVVAPTNGFSAASEFHEWAARQTEDIDWQLRSPLPWQLQPTK
jgi:hypothetical protein